MPSKRTVVELFDKNELQSIVAEYDLAVADKRAKDQLIDAVASSKKATLKAVLPAFSRDRLKALCRTLGLDPSGREKAALIERLTGKPSRVPLPFSKGRSEKKKTKVTNYNNSADFEKNLWDTANKLRGTVESSEYKHVVLSLIFLKFISDKFEERREQLINEGKASRCCVL
jgi:type I restriction enzyme M protein